MATNAFSPEAFAAEWCAAFNAHDLERILSHYAEDVTLVSPLVPRVLGEGVREVVGKAMLRAYFSRGLALRPNLHFTLRTVYHGVGGIVIGYRTQDGTDAAEQIDIDVHGHVRFVRAHYGARA